MPRIRNPRPCLGCGRPTTLPNQICRLCPTFDISNVPVNYLHQFIGVFHSEGCISIRRNQKVDNAVYISLAIKLRADDGAVVEQIHNYFGGLLATYRRSDNHSPEACWTLKKTVDIQYLLGVIKELTVIPAKKMFDVEIGLSFCEWFLSKDFHNYDRSYGLELRKRLMDSRSYKD